MIHRSWEWTAAGALAAASLAVQGQPADDLLDPDRCHAPVQQRGPLLADREDRIAQYEGLGEQCLKRLMLACDAQSRRELLDSGAAFACSIGYEALLRRGFGGNFQALLAWWRERRDAPEFD